MLYLLVSAVLVRQECSHRFDGRAPRMNSDLVKVRRALCIAPATKYARETVNRRGTKGQTGDEDRSLSTNSALQESREGKAHARVWPCFSFFRRRATSIQMLESSLVSRVCKTASKACLTSMNLVWTPVNTSLWWTRQNIIKWCRSI